MGLPVGWRLQSGSERPRNRLCGKHHLLDPLIRIRVKHECEVAGIFGAAIKREADTAFVDAQGRANTAVC